MTSLHIFEFLEKFGKLIQFGGGGRPLVIQIITLDVLGLFCPSKQMPQNSHPTKLFPFHMGDFVLTFHFICWVILSDFDSSEKLNDVSETRRQLWGSSWVGPSLSQCRPTATTILAIQKKVFVILLKTDCKDYGDLEWEHHSHRVPTITHHCQNPCTLCGKVLSKTFATKEGSWDSVIWARQKDANLSQ